LKEERTRNTRNKSKHAKEFKIFRVFRVPKERKIIRKAAQAGWFRSMLSGEGIVAEFKGPGELLIQTRNLAAFAGILKPFFPTQSGSGGVNLGTIFGE